MRSCPAAERISRFEAPTLRDLCILFLHIHIKIKSVHFQNIFLPLTFIRELAHLQYICPTHHICEYGLNDDFPCCIFM